MIEYIGENRIAGQLGELLVILSFISGILACIFYYKGSLLKNQDDSWRKLGRLFFQIQSVSIFSFIAILFYLLASHSFEYYYVWRHSSTELPLRFMLS